MSKKKDKNNKPKKGNKNSGKEYRFDHRVLKHRVFRWGIVGLLSLIVMVLSMFWIPGEVHYEITEIYSFTGSESASVNLAVLLPTTGPYQTVLDPEIIWLGSWDSQTNNRLNVIQFTKDLKAGETVDAVVKYQVNLHQGPVRWQQGTVNPETLSSNDLIQSDHPNIIAQAEALLVNGNDKQTVQQIFRFTRRHLEWPGDDRIKDDLSALNAYQSGVGSYIEHATLMTALCRAADIPAQVVTGLVLPETIPFIPVSATWNHPADAHAWVEVFIDHAWQIADPSLPNQFYKRNIFGWIDGKHLVFDEMTHESQVYQILMAEAEENGTWIAAMSAPLRFVSWSEMPIESMQFTPRVTLRKIWDTRLLMMFSIVLILVVLTWISGGKEGIRREKG